MPGLMPQPSSLSSLSLSSVMRMPLRAGNVFVPVHHLVLCLTAEGSICQVSVLCSWDGIIHVQTKMTDNCRLTKPLRHSLFRIFGPPTHLASSENMRATSSAFGFLPVQVL